MKAYEYVNIHIGKFVGAGSEAHRAIIDEYAARDYRYVGYLDVYKRQAHGDVIPQLL